MNDADAASSTSDQGGETAPERDTQFVAVMVDPNGLGFGIWDVQRPYSDTRLPRRDQILQKRGRLSGACAQRQRNTSPGIEEGKRRGQVQHDAAH